MAINDDLLYEVNEQGEVVVVKSMESEQRVYLRFTNMTSRPVDVWWRDFEGIKQRYARLRPNASYDVNSYLTHPWEFTDAQTKERYNVSNKPIFRAPDNIGGMNYRTNWNVTVGVRTLRATALLAIALRIPDNGLIIDLGLPQLLQDDLHDLIEQVHALEPYPAE